MTRTKKSNPSKSAAIELGEAELDAVKGAATALPSGTTRSGLQSNTTPGGSGETKPGTSTIGTGTSTITYTGLE